MLLILFVSRMPVNTLVDFAEIANKTDNFTGADLKLLLKEVIWNCILVYFS